MSEIKKLTPEELDSVKAIKNEYTNLAVSLGELELQKANIAKEKQRLLDTQSQLIEKENEIAKTLSDKYGNGTINLETGEIN
jgi:septal ring factor EnvC (AmiA/AmiB activator)